MIKHFHQTGLILLLSVFFACSKPSDEIPGFSSNQDTLIIATKLNKGAGEFDRIFSILDFTESDELSYSLKLPNNLTNIKHDSRPVDWDAYIYYEYLKEGKHKYLVHIEEAISENKLDTTQLPTIEQNQIDIITGILDSVQVFILDENNNEDLTDDSVRTIQPMNFPSGENLIKTAIYVNNGGKIVEDSTWIKIGTLGSNPMLFFGVSEYVTADLYLDNKFYQLGAADFQSLFSYLEPRLVLLKADSVGKDSVYLRDMLFPNEFVRLNNNYYRIHQVAKYGDYITLVKEPDFDSKIGTQVGIKAPDFTAVTITGDTIVSSNMHDKPMLIANSCECGGDMKSLIAYNEIRKKYGEKAHVIHIDSGMRLLENNEGIHIEMEYTPNINLYNLFRKTYCSRECYVIDVNNTVIDKFFITDWKEILPKILDTEEEVI